MCWGGRRSPFGTWRSRISLA